MDFEITSSVDRDVLVITFTGQLTEKNVSAMTTRYFEIVLGAGLKKVLVDIRPLQGRLAPGSTYFIVRNLPVDPVPSEIKTAVIELQENQSHAEFLEATSANAGVYLRCFLDYEDALLWLRS